MKCSVRSRGDRPPPGRVPGISVWQPCCLLLLVHPLVHSFIHLSIKQFLGTRWAPGLELAAWELHEMGSHRDRDRDRWRPAKWYSRGRNRETGTFGWKAELWLALRVLLGKPASKPGLMEASDKCQERGDGIRFGCQKCGLEDTDQCQSERPFIHLFNHFFIQQIIKFLLSARPCLRS